ncbi:MAG: DUF2799 domain-containing protein [Pseudomonadota bacterium]
MSSSVKHALTLSAAVCWLGILAACQTISKEECAVANWSDLGQRDGQAGYPASRIERHAKACAKAGIAVDSQSYLAARSVGIRSYCTPANGLSVGRSGASYRNSCPADLEPGFLRTYNAASKLRRAERSVESARRRVDSVTDRAFGTDLTPEQRLNLQRELNDARADLRNAEFDLRRAEIEYQQVRATVA